VEIPAKRVQILKELVPRLSRIAFLTNLDFPGTRATLATTERAALTLSLSVQTFDVRGELDVDSAFARMVRDGIGGGVAAAELGLGTTRSRIVTLATRYRLPFVHPSRQAVEEGGLVSYQSNRHDMFRRAAHYVDRILRGTRPADLPFEQPATYELVINLKTARALGLAISPSFLRLADVVIE
jgi:putative ABC transport system substrate-binding protein